MIDRKPYLHRVHYYETDQMGIVHHSNYIRWFEEARDDFIARNGIDYVDVEARGFMLAVIRAECKYKTPAKYGETVEITTHLRRFNGVRVVYTYEIKNALGALVATGTTEHAFISAETRKPVSVKRELPEYTEIMFRLLEENGDGGSRRK